MPIEYARYPANWSDEIVPRILARANHQCEVCGIANRAKVYSVALEVKEGTRYKLRRVWVTAHCDMLRLKSICKRGQSIKLISVVLTVAHLDHDEENHSVSDDRLKAMCQLCHLNYDATEKYRRAISKVVKVSS
jgi:hypothetical protein